MAYVGSMARKFLALAALASILVLTGVLFGATAGAEEANDLCANVSGVQTSTPCADETCAAASGTWNGSSCDMPQSASLTTEQLTVATSTDGTGGQFGGTIETGNATASTTVDNELNTNDTVVPDVPGKMNSSDLTSSTTNDAILGTEDETVADTGQNNASGGDGLASITTGNAVSTANVINLVNTNLFNSKGLLLFLNQIFGNGLDLRGYDLSYFFNATSTTGCTILTCLNSSSVNVLDDNDAVVNNSVIVRAATGENTATSTESGDATIATGAAYAAANVLNLVNTNLINSNYLLISFNNFGDLTGDIIFPAADFFKRLLAEGGFMPEMNSSTYDVNADNTVDFTGTTTVTALTGENIASSTSEFATSTDSSGGLIETGNAYSNATTITEANKTMVGGTSIFFLFRVWGAWNGEIRGLPEGISVVNTPLGFILVSDNSSSTSPLTRGEFNSSSFLASTTNNALVNNDVNVTAATGQNAALTASGTPKVSTGDAYAVASVLNLINTTIVNRNWLFAIFNVFGNWDGDVSFGGNMEESVIKDMDEVVVAAPAPSGGGGGSGGGGPIGLLGPALAQSAADPNVAIGKTATIEQHSTSTLVNYRVIVVNAKDAGPVFNGRLTDTLTGPHGVVHERSWELGTLNPGEQLVLTYTAEFTSSSTAGTYTNVARVTGSKGSAAGSAMKPAEASATVEISPQGIVLGATSATEKQGSACFALLTKSMRKGARNDASEVKKLQQFLNDDVQARLPITGLFGPMTDRAVRSFQMKYKDDILKPLGLSSATGAVYASTMRVMNNVHCGSGSSAPSSRAGTTSAKEAQIQLLQSSIADITAAINKLLGQKQ